MKKSKDRNRVEPGLRLKGQKQIAYFTVGFPIAGFGSAAIFTRSAVSVRWKQAQEK